MHIIGIVPVVAPQEIYDSGKWKESTNFRCNKSIACIVVRMNFENYYNADSLEKTEQIKEMVLAAVKRIKSKGKFDCDKFTNDLLSLK